MTSHERYTNIGTIGAAERAGAESLEAYPHLAQDLAGYHAACQFFLGRLDIRSTPPPNMVPATNARRSFYDPTLCKSVVLKEQGAPIALVETAVDIDGNPLPSQLAIYVDTSQMFFRPYISPLARPHGLASLLDYIGGNLVSCPALPAVELKPYDHGFLYLRAFVTSHLYKVAKWGTPEASRHENVTYEALRAKGIQPFDIEQIFGIVKEHVENEGRNLRPRQYPDLLAIVQSGVRHSLPKSRQLPHQRRYGMR